MHFSCRCLPPLETIIININNNNSSRGKCYKSSEQVTREDCFQQQLLLLPPPPHNMALRLLEHPPPALRELLNGPIDDAGGGAPLIIAQSITCPVNFNAAPPAPRVPSYKMPLIALARALLNSYEMSRKKAAARSSLTPPSFMFVIVIKSAASKCHCHRNAREGGRGRSEPVDYRVSDFRKMRQRSSPPLTSACD